MRAFQVLLSSASAPQLVPGGLALAGSPNCDGWESAKTLPLKPPAAAKATGISAAAPLWESRSRETTSSSWDFRCSLPHLEPPVHPAEPPRYGPVRPVVWEGRSRKAPPYPDFLGTNLSGRVQFWIRQIF